MHLPIYIITKIHRCCSIDIRRTLEKLFQIPTICYPLGETYDLEAFESLVKRTSQIYKNDNIRAYDIYLMTQNRDRILYIIAYNGLAEGWFAVYHRTPIKLDCYIACTQCQNYRIIDCDGDVLHCKSCGWSKVEPMRWPNAYMFWAISLFSVCAYGEVT